MLHTLIDHCHSQITWIYKLSFIYLVYTININKDIYTERETGDHTV